MHDEVLITEVGRRLHAAAPGAQVIMFGSRARGDHGPDSDLDILVVEETVNDAAAESIRLREAIAGLPIFADVIAVDAAEASHRRHALNDIVGVAFREGRPLAA